MNFIRYMNKINRRARAHLNLMFSEASININCTEFEVNNWAISNFVLSRLLPIVGVRPFPLNELMIMSGAVCRLKPTHIFEWGTHIGKSARIFYETTKYFKIECIVHSVDLPDKAIHVEHPGRSRGKLVKKLGSVLLYQGDGLDTSLRVYNQLEDNKKVLFFLDGDHRYESIKRELDGIISDIPEAWIIVHDTFYQSEDAKYNIGPYQAVEDSIRKAGPRYKRIIQNTGRPGMILLYPADELHRLK
jgi:cephalosporin hydroxylase